MTRDETTEIFGQVMAEVMEEMARGDTGRSYPVNDPLRSAALVVEEAAEALQAALDHTRKQQPPVFARSAVYRETVQAAAMALKHLIAIRTGDYNSWRASR